MKKENRNVMAAIRFRRFCNSPYAVFRSLNRQVSIGVLTVASLTTVHVGQLSAQSVVSSARQEGSAYELEEVEVTGSLAPLATGQAVRLVSVLSSEDIAAASVQSVNDLLKYAVGVDVRQRGAIGAQTDISVRGGTNEQVTILLNGVNVCDPQTGHNAVDLPVDIADIERIEVLEGPAGRVYGTSSLVGAINIVTRQAKSSGIDVNLEGGSYGYLHTVARASAVGGRVSQQLSGGYTRSDGYTRSQAGTLNGDYEGSRLFYQGRYSHPQVDVSWHAGLSDKGWGSSTFYATPRWKADDQFEHTLKLFTTVQAETKGFLHLQPSVYWNRNHDRYEGYRGKPDVMKYNYNRTDVMGVHLKAHFQTVAGTTAFGAEMRNEDLRSGNLGEPLNHPRRIHGTDREYTLGLNRTNLSLHLEHNLLLGPLSVSAGFIAARNTWNEADMKLYPGIDAGLRLGERWKLYASYNTSLRMPSFTELYYSVGGHKADKYLRPEEMRATEAGLRYQHGGVRGTLAVYRHHGTNMIDWILDSRQGDEAVWTSVNHTKVNAIGTEAQLALDMQRLLPRQHLLQQFSVAYHYASQDKDLEPGVQSQYALEYLRHKLVVRGDFRLCSRLTLSTAYRWQDRVGDFQRLDGEVCQYAPYGVLDGKLSWNASRYTAYVEGNNLFGKTYYDYGNVPQPGRWVMAGIRWRLAFK